MFEFPGTRPAAAQSASMVWTIQNELLARAEASFGSRNHTKRIYQPIFRSDGPIVVNTPNFDGGFAALSPNAAGYWPTVVYELAHETVHLLDPIAGATNWLEEGAAVLFAVAMSRSLTPHPMVPEPGSAFAEAAALVEELPQPVFDSVRLVRLRAGRLSSVTAEIIRSAFPSVSEALAARLVQQCTPR